MERSWTISGVCGLRKRPGMNGGGETGRAGVFRLDRISLRRYFLFWFCGTTIRSAVILQCDLSVRLKSDLVIGLTSTLFYKLLEGFLQLDPMLNQAGGNIVGWTMPPHRPVSFWNGTENDTVERGARASLAINTYHVLNFFFFFKKAAFLCETHPV